MTTISTAYRTRTFAAGALLASALTLAVSAPATATNATALAGALDTVQTVRNAATADCLDDSGGRYAT
ncbi:hypothetical protein ACFWCB_05610 [Streptomyces sp. NPDC060048]|uniref:hypothetical protein n=1 Tax=unclassified Streptomyces TaxID=2593676 RepID=UPI00367A09C2